ncbi:RAB7A-interacting MON1-CCZ1 complex subunit 1-like [Corticium candelabrum]|uniref:RAB7A-interacting MON1-CCZ1 complex subunit 1-like n=1 Tax=Corticium candelabrum TaxID=121492 RepID=UPI002E273453|nr:RAB7A-interacting MON1-CCZ1 complex subunit 1-like [Corticium candelabrum]
MQPTNRWRIRISGICKLPGKMCDVSALGETTLRLIESRLKDNSGNELLLRAERHCRKIEVSLASNRRKEAVQSWILSELDYTYHEEQMLVEATFSDYQNLHDILERLSKALAVGQQEEVDIDILECIYWRRGALLYMYCNTVNKHPDKQTDQYTDCLSKGIQELSAMLSVRTRPKGAESQDEQTQKLLEEGIFSDTHVLALMYAGEMCYWLLTHSEPSDTSQHTQLVKQCHHFLTTYIFVTEGPLKLHGWSTDRAKQILSQVVNQKT